MFTLNVQRVMASARIAIRCAASLAAILCIALAGEAVAACYDKVDGVQRRFILDGGEAHDTKTSLTWQRCSLGMTWDGKGCNGEQSFKTLAEAVATAKTDKSLPKGPDSTLSFPQFVKFAAATANRRLDAHWHLQDDLLTMPGIKLDLVGKLESFGQDFASVLNHAGASVRLRQIADVHFNASQHKPWPNYYTADLADRVYRAYERDFDRFNYSRTIPA